MDPSISKKARREAFRCLNIELNRADFSKRFRLPDPATFISKVYAFSRNFNNAFILNNCFPNEHSEATFLAGLGIAREFRASDDKAVFASLRDFLDAEKGNWVFGALAYDAKNDVEALSSSNSDVIGFPPCHFFVPEILIYVNGNVAGISSSGRDEEVIFGRIGKTDLPDPVPSALAEDDFESIPGREEYIASVTSLLSEISLGNIYEVNFCRELRRTGKMNPYSTALNLLKNSPAPFSVFYKSGSRYLICASPERFLLKSGNILISQPMKGTRPRSSNAEEDRSLLGELKSDEKERAENVMIVDLVRNDLSRSAERASVRADELYGLYSFPKVHQMVSTVSSKLREDVHFTEAIRHCFPMGSMTGAPKLRAMELIEKHEKFRRSLFSGATGVVTPLSNFDFNVVIRSILYNESSGQISIRTGSAITHKCRLEKEWDECRLKAMALVESICL